MMMMLVRAIAIARGPKRSTFRTPYPINIIIIALASRRGFKSIKRLQ